MKLNEAEKFANEQMDKWLEFPKSSYNGKRLWRFKFDNAISRFGVCRYDERVISISKVLTLANEPEVVHDTILHEIAHALSPRDEYHGKIWKENCLKVGANPVAKYNPMQVKTPPKRYRVVCDSGHYWYRHRKIDTKRYKCICGSNLICVDESKE